MESSSGTITPSKGLIPGKNPYLAVLGPLGRTLTCTPRHEMYVVIEYAQPDKQPGILSYRRSFPKDPMRFIPAQAEAERVGSGSGYR